MFEYWKFWRLLLISVWKYKFVINYMAPSVLSIVIVIKKKSVFLDFMYIIGGNNCCKHGHFCISWHHIVVCCLLKTYEQQKLVPQRFTKYSRKFYRETNMIILYIIAMMDLFGTNQYSIMLIVLNPSYCKLLETNISRHLLPFHSIL